MPFDTMALAAVADELQPLAGGRIQRVIQPSAASIALGIYAGSHRRWLLLSADARHARAHVATGPLAKGFATPSPFVMLLRKHLDGRRLATLAQTPYERILTLEVAAAEGRVRLVAEFMGKHSNLILVDDAGTILGAVKAVPERLSRLRPILPGRQYVPPPRQGRDERIFGPGDRIDPLANSDAVAHCLQLADQETAVAAALGGLLPGCSPFMAEHIALAAGANGNQPLSEADSAQLAGSARDLYSLVDNHGWQPVTFHTPRRACDFAPYHPRGVEELCPAAGMSVAIEACVGSVESLDALGCARRVVLEEVERSRRRVTGRMDSLREGLAATGDAERSREIGQLILAYQHLVERGQRELRIAELDETIELDARLTPQENAERQFRRYRKLRDARDRIPGLLAAAESEAARLDELRDFVRLASEERELRRLQREISGEPATPQEPGRREKAPRAGPARFRLGNHVALVGRSAQENELVTFRLAGRRDLWLHARGWTGAHVVLQGSDPPPDTVSAAAALAAFHSAGRADGAVDVDVVPVRDVRKVPGGPPGRVTYRNHRTVRVAPGLGDWKKL